MESGSEFPDEQSENWSAIEPHKPTPVFISKKKVQELTDLHICQSMRKHEGQIWVMQYSKNYQYLATGGKDTIIYVWKVREVSAVDWNKNRNGKIFEDEPICKFEGHSSHIVDLAWSNSNFLLSASLDQTVRLWHVDRSTCLCSFRHSHLVTSVDFLPTDEGYFATGSMDRRLRVWSIVQGRVVKSIQTPAIITAITFCSKSRLLAAGLLDGQVVYYYADGLCYFNQSECRNRKGKESGGRKVTGIAVFPESNGKQILVTTNDSRIRSVNLDNFGVTNKYKGVMNSTNMQLKATISSDGMYVSCASTDGYIYLWRTSHESDKQSSSVPVKKIDSYEKFQCCMANEHVTCSSIIPDQVIEMSCPGELERVRLAAKQAQASIEDSHASAGFAFISGTSDGCLYVFASFSKPVKL